MAYDLYSMCRGEQMMQVTKDKMGKTVTSFVAYPNGYRQLPWQGGMLDQPYRLMQLFSAFENGEMLAFGEKIK